MYALELIGPTSSRRLLFTVEKREIELEGKEIPDPHRHGSR
jgi:hypothetical protein